MDRRGARSRRSSPSPGSRRPCSRTSICRRWPPARASLADFTPKDTPAIATEARSAQVFGQPISRVAVVQRNPAGLSPDVQRQTVAAAVDLTQHPRDPLLGALPLIDDPRVWPKAGDTATTAVTYLYFTPSTPWAEQVRLARAYAQARLTQPGASVVGVTGSVPARVAQEDAVAARLNAVEIATVILVALVLGLTFGSVLAPVVTLLAAGVAYVIGSRLVALAGRELGLAPPSEIDPLVVVLAPGDRRGLRDLLPLGSEGAARLWATGADRPHATRRRSSRRSSSSPGSWSQPARRPCSPRPRRRSARSGPAWRSACWSASSSASPSSPRRWPRSAGRCSGRAAWRSRRRATTLGPAGSLASVPG